MAGWIKVPLDTEVGLDQSNIVLDGTQLQPSEKGGRVPPNFRPTSIVPNGWLDKDATWYEGKPQPRPHCVTWGPPHKNRGRTSPNFRPMSIVAKRSPISGTAEHLYDVGLALSMRFVLESLLFATIYRATVTRFPHTTPAALPP